jgi:D-glycero-D-manno-heptose 1,7-bisphosphate phosphatase
MKKALFLDRDGIINIDKTYIYRYEDIEWVEGIFDLIQFANKNNFLVIVLTNQSGVAQGMYQEEDILILHKKMSEHLKGLKLTVDDWFYCTEYNSERRKPRPGMMIEAQTKHHIDLAKSFMIGDKPTDILEIKGPKTFLLQGNYALDAVLKNKSAEVFDSLKKIQNRIEEIISE